MNSIAQSYRMITYDQVVARVRDPKPDRDGTLFFCPCHPDGTKHNRRSARTWPLADGIAGVKCFAGCNTRDILQALGFDFSNNGDHRHESETVYDYHDIDGKLSYQVVRFPANADGTKNMKQRRPDGKGDWIWNLKGVKPLLYRLPETWQAVNKGETVFIPEGEKDCNNLTRLGLAATTNSGGAGKWQDGLSDHLTGAVVVILPDNDEPGRKHADKVARSLQGKAKSIKVVDLPGLPEKGDVSDWLAAGGTKEELLRMVAEAPEWGPEMQEQPKELFRPITVRLSDIEPEEVSWLWEPYIPIGKLTILEGDPGIGKTFAALAVTAAVTSGAGLPGTDGRPGPGREPHNVIYMTAEDGLADTLRPRLDAIGADVSRVIALTGYAGYDETGQETELPVTMKSINVLDKALEEHKPLLLVIDPLQAYLGAGVDMHRSNETRPVLAGIANLAEKHACAVLLIRHLGKSQQDRAIYRGLGSIDFIAAARSVLLAGQDPQDPTKRAIIQTKNSVAPWGASIGYEIRDGQFFWTGLSDLTAGQVLSADAKFSESGSKLDEAKDFLRDYLADGPKSAKETISASERSGIEFVTLKRAKQASGIESYQEPGKRGNWFYRLSQSPDQSGSEGQDPYTSILDPMIENPVSHGRVRLEGVSISGSHDPMNENPELLEAQALQRSQSPDQESAFIEPEQIMTDDPVIDLMEVRI
jgi:hypothetical protein